MKTFTVSDHVVGAHERHVPGSQHCRSLFSRRVRSNHKQVVTQCCVALIEENRTPFIVMIDMYDEIRSSDFRANQHYTQNAATENEEGK